MAALSPYRTSPLNIEFAPSGSASSSFLLGIIAVESDLDRLTRKIMALTLARLSRERTLIAERRLDVTPVPRAHREPPVRRVRFRPQRVGRACGGYWRVSLA